MMLLSSLSASFRSAMKECAAHIRRASEMGAVPCAVACGEALSGHFRPYKGMIKRGLGCIWRERTVLSVLGKNFAGAAKECTAHFKNLQADGWKITREKCRASCQHHLNPMHVYNRITECLEREFDFSLEDFSSAKRPGVRAEIIAPVHKKVKGYESFYKKHLVPVMNALFGRTCFCESSIAPAPK